MLTDGNRDITLQMARHGITAYGEQKCDLSIEAIQKTPKQGSCVLLVANGEGENCPFPHLKASDPHRIELVKHYSIG